jgi:hypothetical protein
MIWRCATEITALMLGFMMLVLPACTQCAKSQPAVSNPSVAEDKKRTSLHVSLPSGWTATAIPGGLEAGPEGRVVVSMQSGVEKMPEIAVVEATLLDEKVSITLKEVDSTFLGVQYVVARNGSGNQAFVAFKSVEGRTVRCASGSASGSDEVILGYEVCRSLTGQ